MPRKAMRKVAASEDIAALIDEGHKVNTEMTNLSFRDKGLKKKISDAAVFEDGEISIVLEGNVHQAVVTAAEKIEVSIGSERFAEVESAVSDGFLEDAIEVKKTLQIPGKDVEMAAKILQEAGIAATLKTNYSVNPAAYREFGDEGSPERAKAKSALDECVERTRSFRVKYK